MRYGGKHAAPFEFRVPLMSGGLNRALNAVSIADNEVASERNIWLSPMGEYETRPGFAKVTDAGTSHAIDGLYYSAETAKHLVASNNKLYTLDTSTGALTEVGNLNGTNTATSFADFNGACYIAHGGTLQVYNGSTLADVTGSGDAAPADASFVKAMSTRLWVAGSGSTAYWCGANDPTDWGGDSPRTGGFAYIEKGDGGVLTGLGLIDGMPVLFKGGAGRRKSITICAGDTPTDFVFKCVSEGTAATSGLAVDNLNGDMLFCAEEGVQSLGMIRDYDNPKAFPLSLKILPSYTTYTPVSACSDPKRGYFYAVTSRDVFAFHAGTKGWHRWVLNGITPKVIAQVSGDNIYIGASDGHVYRLSEGAYLDGGAAFTWDWATRAYDFGNVAYTNRSYDSGAPMRNKLIKWINLGYTPLSGSGTGGMTVYYRTNYGQVDEASSSVTVSGDSSVGWDGAFAWDAAGVGWDETSYIEKRRRVHIVGSNIQFGFAGNVPVRLNGITVSGAVLSRTTGDYQTA